MGPKKLASGSPLVKVRNTLEVKDEIVQKCESGVHVGKLARLYGESKTIPSILVKGKVKEADVAKGVDMLTKNGSQSEVEMLVVWINNKKIAGDSCDEWVIVFWSLVCEKAR